MSEFYKRTTALHLDGSPIFTTAGDRATEQQVAAVLENAWRCRMIHFGLLSPLDWYSTRDDRLVGVLELKARSHASDRYPTVFLSVRKWLALITAGIGLGVPALFVVQFTDGVRWCRVADIDASQHRMGGCRPRPGREDLDVEPLIEVPVLFMRTVP
jgi:hypothetical protein